MKLCKWCDNPIQEKSDKACDPCFEFVHLLNHALHTKKLFTMMKRLVAARVKEIHKDGHF